MGHLHVASRSLVPQCPHKLGVLTPPQGAVAGNCLPPSYLNSLPMRTGRTQSRGDQRYQLPCSQLHRVARLLMPWGAVTLGRLQGTASLRANHFPSLVPVWAFPGAQASGQAAPGKEWVWAVGRDFNQLPSRPVWPWKLHSTSGRADPFVHGPWLFLFFMGLSPNFLKSCSLPSSLHQSLIGLQAAGRWLSQPGHYFLQREALCP